MGEDMLLMGGTVTACVIVDWGTGEAAVYFFFLRRQQPPRSTHGRSSAASDVYKRQ